MTKENQMDDLMMLPEPTLHDGVVVNANGKYIGTFDGYTVDQMNEYAKKAVEAERVSPNITTEMLQAAAEEYDQWADENKGTYECIRAMLVKALLTRRHPR